MINQLNPKKRTVVDNTMKLLNNSVIGDKSTFLALN
jgi:hypothetical protein